jgi:uncharacterized protein YgiM (DUF1202 family)
MKKYTIILLGIFVFSFIFVTPSFAASSKASVTADVLIVRNGPGKNYKKISELSKGKVVTVLEKKNGWYRVAKNEWVMGKFLKTVVVKKTTPVAVVAETLPDPSVSSTASTTTSNPVSIVRSKPTSSCMAAILSANNYCMKASAGCHSWSTSEKCLEANRSCDERQQAAMELCPQEN